MPPRTTEAFVLDAVPARERDKLVTLLTESEGKVRGLAHGAARSVRRFGGRLERLGRVRVTFFEKEGVDLVRIDDLELIEEAFSLQRDLRAAAALAYVCEITAELAREKEADQRFYRLLGATLEGFRAGLAPASALRYFEYWTARLNGIFPSFEACDACGRAFGGGGARVGVAEGAALCGSCAAAAGGRSFPIGPAALTVLDAFRRAAPAALVNVVFPRPALREIEAAAAAALAEFSGREFRSREYLGQVMREEAG